MDMGWELAVVLPPVFEYESFAQYPNIKPGREFEGYPAEGAGDDRA